MRVSRRENGKMSRKTERSSSSPRDNTLAGSLVGAISGPVVPVLYMPLPYPANPFVKASPYQPVIRLMGLPLFC